MKGIGEYNTWERERNWKKKGKGGKERRKGKERKGKKRNRMRMEYEHNTRNMTNGGGLGTNIGNVLWVGKFHFFFHEKKIASAVFDLSGFF